MARMAGLEPATAALTVRCSTIELHPNWWRESDSNRRSSGYGPAAGTTPVNPALSQEVIIMPCLVLQLPRKSRHQHKRIQPENVTPVFTKNLQAITVPTPFIANYLANCLTKPIWSYRRYKSIAWRVRGGIFAADAERPKHRHHRASPSRISFTTAERIWPSSTAFA